MTRTITQPANNSALNSAVIRAELQTLEDEIADPSSIDPGHLHTVAGIDASGTPSSLTFLRGDNTWATPIDTGGKVDSVTGLNTDNTDPVNPVVQISVDGVSITGAGTPGSPLVAAGAIPFDLTLEEGINSVSNVDTIVFTGGVALTDDGGGQVTVDITALANPMTTLGDLIAGGVSGAPTRLAVGTNGDVLTVVSGEPAWASLPSPVAPGGSDTQLQFNNNGAFGGISGATTNGTAVTFGSGGLIAPDITNTGVLTLPTSTDTLVGRATTDTLTNKQINPRLSSTTSFSTAITPTFTSFDAYEATAQDDTITLNLPSGLADGASMVLRFVMANTETFTPNGDYLWTDGNDAPADFEGGYIYEVIVSECAGEFLASWTRYDNS